MKNKNTAGKELKYEDLSLPGVEYSTIASRIGDAELSVLDIMAAAVLSGRTLLIVGHSEKGKSYIAKKIRDYWFGGKGNLIQAASLDEATELFTQVFKEISKEKATQIVLEEKLRYPFIFVDEVGAIPKGLQSQLWPIGDGILNHKGEEFYLGVPLGEDRYFCYIACTNTLREEENGEYSNFGITKATASRFHLLLDTRRKLRRKTEDLVKIINSEDVDVRHAETKEVRDITERIMEAYMQIKEKSRNASIEERIALAYLTVGTGRCKKGQRYEDDWQSQCMQCDENNERDCPAKYLFGYEMLRQTKNIRVFANALHYVASLKSKELDGKVDAFDAVFEAAKFVIAGKYSTMNELLRREKELPDYDFIENAIEELKEEFNKVRPCIELSIEMARRYDKVVTQFYKEGDKMIPICREFFEEAGRRKHLKGDKLKRFVEECLRKVDGSILEPYNSDGYVDLSWVPELIAKALNKSKNGE